MAFPSIFAYLSSFIPGRQLVDGGDCLFLAQQVLGVQTGLTALAGGAASGAPQLKVGVNEVTTVVTDNDSVALPPALSGGAPVVVVNSGGHTLAIFPAQSNPNNANSAGDQIIPYNSVTPGAAASGDVTIATVKATAFYPVRPGVWKQVLWS